MELKVWVDSIQRVVCGVTDSSTCQDVVYALAHATGQTGRFTLVEKWRNSERLLAPHEQPLKVLMKWGEYANNVHFVMRRSSEVNSKSQMTTQLPTQNNKRQHDFLHNFSPTNSNQNQKLVVNNKEIKKSLTFSCGHASSGSVSSENSTAVVNNNNNSTAKVESPPHSSHYTKNRESRSRQDLPKGVVRGIPQKPKDVDSSGLARPKHPPPYDEAVSRSSGRFAPSQLTVASTTVQLSQDEESPSSKRRHLAVKNEQHDANDQIVHHKSVPNRQSTKAHITNSPDRNANTSTTSSKNIHPSEKDKSPSKKQTSSQNIVLEDIHSIKSKQNLIGRLENDKKIVSDSSHQPIAPKGNNAKPEESNGDSQCQDLMRLVSLQKEKLGNQQSEITQYDAEIHYWENQLQEQEEKLRLLQEEYAHLDKTRQAQESELHELDRRPFNEEVELGRQEERTLRSELTLARSQLSNCETELLQCHQRIRLLLEEITEEKHLQSQREEEEKKELEEQEQHLQEQLENLHQQLKNKTSENSNQKSTVDQVAGELHDVDFKISEKQREVERLMEEIRDANLFSLSLVPTEDGKSITEGNFYNRAGSTRKIIGSPRQLENAVPTNKNPHGVWV